jgi:hypothetical protein
VTAQGLADAESLPSPARRERPPRLSDGELAAITAEFQTGAPFGFGLSPALAPMRLYQSMSACVDAFIAGSDALMSAFGNDPIRLARVLGMPEQETGPWDALPDNNWAVIGRPDILVQGDRAMLIDPNFASPAGLFPLNDKLLRAHRSAPARRFFGTHAVPRFVMGTYADLLRRYAVPGHDLVAISYFSQEDNGVEEEDGLHGGGYNWSYDGQADEVTRLGLPARVVHVEDLEASEAGVYSAGDRVGLVHRFFLQPDPAIPGEAAAFSGLQTAAWARTVGVFTGFRGERFVSKAMMAALSDERYSELLPTGLSARLSRALPWTRMLEERTTLAGGAVVDLLPWTASHREELVLKAAHGFSGLQTLIGRETTAAQWEQTIERAARGEAWVVQELIVPDPEPLLVPVLGELVEISVPVVYGAFILDRRFVGAIRRYGVEAATTLNITGWHGAIPAPVYWVGGT